MFNRRTLAALTAVAALTGGSAGAITSSVATPESAQAQAPPRPVITTIGRKVTQVNPVVLAEVLRTDSDRIRAIEKSVNNLTAAVARLDDRTSNIDAGLDGLSRMTARDSQGRSLINLVSDTLGKTRLICAETVPVEVLGISGHDPACD